MIYVDLRIPFLMVALLAMNILSKNTVRSLFMRRSLIDSQAYARTLPYSAHKHKRVLSLSEPFSFIIITPSNPTFYCRIFDVNMDRQSCHIHA
jgi:hypothetical protein